MAWTREDQAAAYAGELLVGIFHDSVSMSILEHEWRSAVSRPG